MRSVSIQNNSTQISSKSDTDETDLKRNTTSRPVQSGSNVTSRKNSTIEKLKNDNPIKQDIMELISEEEMSVCKSEGSPPKKKVRAQKSQKRSVICPVPIVTNQKKPGSS